jgi:hypothetical protein
MILRWLRRYRSVLGIALLAVLAVLVVVFVPRARYRVLAWVRGDSYYMDLPTSYWADALLAENGQPPATAGELLDFNGQSGGQPGAGASMLLCSGEAVPVLIELLGNGHPEVRAGAARVLANLGRFRGQPAVPWLIKALDDPDSRVRLEACQALLTLSPGEPASERVLIELTRDQDADVRLTAVQCLVVLFQTGNGTPAAASAIESGFDSLPADLRWRALAGAGRAKPPSLVPLMIKALGDENARVRSIALYAFGAAGSHARPAVPALLRLMRSPEAGNRTYVRYVLRQILFTKEGAQTPYTGEPDAIDAFLECLATLTNGPAEPAPRPATMAQGGVNVVIPTPPGTVRHRRNPTESE